MWKETNISPKTDNYLSHLISISNRIVWEQSPEDIELATPEMTANTIEGHIGCRTFLGKEYQYEVETAIGKFLVNMRTDYSYREGDAIRLHLPEKKLILVEKSWCFSEKLKVRI